MNHPGETAELAAIAQPTIAIINNAQREHQEFMRSVADVAEEHAAIVRALPPGRHRRAQRRRSACRRLARRGARARRTCACVDFALDASAAIRLRRRDRRPRSEDDRIFHPGGRCDRAARRARDGTTCRMRSRRRPRRSRSTFRCERSCAGSRHFVRSPVASLRAAATAGAAVIDDTYNANPGFGGRRDRRACRGARAALARAGRHGRSRRERAALSITKSVHTRALPASTGC